MFGNCVWKKLMTDSVLVSLWHKRKRYKRLYVPKAQATLQETRNWTHQCITLRGSTFRYIPEIFQLLYSWNLLSNRLTPNSQEKINWPHVVHMYDVLFLFSFLIFKISHFIYAQISSWLSLYTWERWMCWESMRIPPWDINLSLCFWEV